MKLRYKILNSLLLLIVVVIEYSEKGHARGKIIIEIN